jgi:hypothetical protein
MLHHVDRRRAGDEVVIHFAAISPEGPTRTRRLTQIERRAERVIKENPIGMATVQADHEWMRLIQRIAPRVVLGRVGVPVDDGRVSFVEWTAPLAESEEVILVAQAHPASNFVVGPGNALARILSGHQSSARIVKRNPARVASDVYAQAVGDEFDSIGLVMHLPRR